MHLLIIGGSDAGISAALRARELDARARITLLLADSYPNYSICGIPYYLSGEVTHWQNLAHRSFNDITALGIQIQINEKAEGIDPAARRVWTRNGTGETRVYSYDKLILATGAVSIRPAIPGMDLAGVFTLRWMEETLALQTFLEQRRPRTALIVGGGYIGVEMAEAFTTKGLEVTVVDHNPTILKTVDRPFGQLLERHLEEKRVQVVTTVSITAIEQKNASTLTVTGTGGFRQEAEVVLIVAGARPATALGESIGITTGVRGAMKVNNRMETGVPHVYAAGDCVETWHRLLEKYSYLPLGTTAHKQGRIAGENAIGGNRSFAGSLGTQAVKIFDLVAARTGLSDREAGEAGLSAVTVQTEAWDHKVYYPGANKLYIRITGEPHSGQLLGAQLLGRISSEVAKRIDVLATALYHNMTVDQISDLDLSYTPPLGSPWDALQMAAQSWQKATSRAE